MNFDLFKRKICGRRKTFKTFNFAVTDKNSRQQKFSNTPKKTDVKNINFEETFENTKKKKQMNPLCSEIEALKATVNELAISKS